MKKKILIGCLILIVMVIGFSPYLLIKIDLNGKRELELNYGDNYEELGANASFLGEELNVAIEGKVNTKVLGTQSVIYKVKNKLGIIRNKKRIVKIIDKLPPVITLTGDTEIDVVIGSKYVDPGYKMIDNVDGDISIKVKVDSTIDTNKVGTYKVIYSGEDSSHNKVKCERIVNVVAKEISYEKGYDNIDNTIRTWWSGNKKNNKRPLDGSGNTIDVLKKYNAYYIGEDKKVIYLTFDEGSNETYLKDIVDVLNANNVKATFFLCNHFIVSNSSLIKDMVKYGHSIGNHTANHKSMPSLANSNNFNQFVNEVRTIENSYYKITGQKMDKVYREPKGEYSYRSLSIIKDMGYKTFFWSADHYDFAGDVSKEETLNRLMARYHNGAIYLLHPKNKGNYEALDTFIKNMKKLGYEFGLVKDINY